MDKESNIVYESSDSGAYVLKIGIGHYKVYANGATCAQRIGEFDNPDEDEDFFARAKEICDDYKNVIKIINKYQK